MSVVGGEARSVLRRWRGLSVPERQLVLATVRLWPLCRIVLRRRGVQAARERVVVAEAAHVGAPTLPPQRVAYLVNRIVDRLPGTSTCLERSLLVASLLGRQGTGADINIGVRQRADGLDFHAWVTVAGDVVYDGGQAVSEYTLLPLGGPPANVPAAERFSAPGAGA